MVYGVVHTTNVLNAKPVSMVNSTTDLENGFVAMADGLAANESQIYSAVQAATATLKNKAYIIAIAIPFYIIP